MRSKKAGMSSLHRERLRYTLRSRATARRDQEFAARLVLSAPHAVVNKVPHLARARAGFMGIAALPGELLALLTPSLIRWIIHVASLAFLTTARE